MDEILVLRDDEENVFFLKKTNKAKFLCYEGMGIKTQMSLSKRSFKALRAISDVCVTIKREDFKPQKKEFEMHVETFKCLK